MQPWGLPSATLEGDSSKLVVTSPQASPQAVTPDDSKPLNQTPEVQSVHSYQTTKQDSWDYYGCPSQRSSHTSNENEQGQDRAD